jgi:hypothetical protein
MKLVKLETHFPEANQVPLGYDFTISYSMELLALKAYIHELVGQNHNGVEAAEPTSFRCVI